MLKNCWLTLSLRPRCNTSQLSMPAKLVNFAFWKALTSSAHNRVNVEGSVPIIKPVTQKCEMHGNEVPDNAAQSVFSLCLQPLKVDHFIPTWRATCCCVFQIDVAAPNDDDFFMENDIVKKNAAKKQRTLSQM